MRPAIETTRLLVKGRTEYSVRLAEHADDGADLPETVRSRYPGGDLAP